jgi:thiosulfate/3-mercaptopyruvate sulfurtransferase
VRYLKSAAGRTVISEILIVLFTAACAYFLLGSDGSSSRQPARVEAESAVTAHSSPQPESPATVVSKSGSGARGDASSDPWTQSQTVDPAHLAKELDSSRGPAKPTVICVAPRALYNGAHIPGALFLGPGYTSQGIDSLKEWARSAPRSTDVVIYCGCCPMGRCPNVRPAFQTLTGMGFTHVRVLLLPHDFHTDWIAPGYSAEKSVAQ